LISFTSLFTVKPTSLFGFGRFSFLAKGSAGGSSGSGNSLIDSLLPSSLFAEFFCDVF
jgi:hypothetical protein